MVLFERLLKGRTEVEDVKYVGKSQKLTILQVKIHRERKIYDLFLGVARDKNVDGVS